LYARVLSKGAQFLFTDGDPGAPELAAESVRLLRQPDLLHNTGSIVQLYVNTTKYLGILLAQDKKSEALREAGPSVVLYRSAIAPGEGIPPPDLLGMYSQMWLAESSQRLSVQRQEELWQAAKSAAEALQAKYPRQAAHAITEIARSRNSSER